MKTLFKYLKSQLQPRQPTFPTFLYEYQSVAWQRSPYWPLAEHTTVFFVVFDGETRHHFSSVRIVLYCPTRWVKDKHAWDIQQSGPVTSTFRGHVDNAPPNDPTLPQLTVVFKVTPRWTTIDYYDLVPRSGDKLLRRSGKSICILLECEQSITPDIQFLSLSFDHSPKLRTTSKGLDSDCDHNMNDSAHVTMRTVRVVPIGGARPRTTIDCLPTELLVKILAAADSCLWQHDLLSFAQVCRLWLHHAMKVLFDRLESRAWKDHCSFEPTQSLDTSALADALVKAPALGLNVQHLNIDQHNGVYLCWNHDIQTLSPTFSPSLIIILRATKNLQRLHLSLGYLSQANKLFAGLPTLRRLRTLSVTQVGCRFREVLSTEYWQNTMSTFQLACCMAHCPALTSLMIEHLKPGTMGGKEQFFSRAPACALTELCLRNTHISDKDLLYLFASSAETLALVTLDGVCGMTYNGLLAFLDSIAGNVRLLGIHAGGPHQCPSVHGKHVLDPVVVKMQALEALSIRGDIASEVMLRRRSEAFVKSGGSGDGAMPVVRLSCRAVPGISRKPTGEEWPGWEVVEFV